MDNEFNEYENNSNSTILKVVKSTSKTRFNHLFLSITFNDKFYKYYNV